MNDQSGIARLTEVVTKKYSTLKSFGKGTNILFDFGESVVLLKYETHGFELLRGSVHTYNRHTVFVAMNFLFANSQDEEIDSLQKMVKYKLQGNFYGTHRLDFEFDGEFGIYLPFSSGQDLFLTLGEEMFDGTVEAKNEAVQVLTDIGSISKRLKEVTRPDYFKKVVEPFLEGHVTEFQVPKWKYHILPFNLSHMHREFAEVASKLEHGNFIYVGCKQEVYLLSLAKDSDGSPYMQGTYTTSAKPLLYFSNNYLNFISRHDAERPRFKGKGSCNVAEYRTYDIPGFCGKPFIFPQMGRSQDCKNVIFTGEPDVITGNIQRALEHFQTTDFAEFSDIVQRYAETISYVHSEQMPNGKYFY